MFRCQLCDKIVPQRTRAQKIVVATRPKSYKPRGSHPVERRGWQSRSRIPIRKTTYDKGGEGTEIVQEIMVCPQCASKKAEEAVAAQAQ